MSVTPANSHPDEKTEEKTLRAPNSHSSHKEADAAKSGGNGKAMADVTWMRSQIIQTAGYESSLRLRELGLQSVLNG